ncbi:hypothetical protein [Streptomyces sp. CB02400]|uniref:hypothetical protein n=1 Tax=Streptomyces sp. CB02400 TaxID=1703944 RepID=UPI0013012A36|nr:hypothetical protein [Streptomyces sp. CB02400]
MVRTHQDTGAAGPGAPGEDGGRCTELYRTQSEQRESGAPGTVAAAGEIVA